MACDITAGFSLGCRDNAGGIKALYILSGSVTTITEVSGEITDIDGSGVFYQFDLTRGTSDFTETINGSTENGTVFYESTVNAVFLKMQSALRNQMKVLAQNPDLKLVVETNNAGTLMEINSFTLVKYMERNLTEDRVRLELQLAMQMDIL
jgi:hypothetical protein